MERRDGLLRRGDEILVVLRVSVHDLVQLLIEIIQLSSLGHVVLEHELRRLESSVSLVGKEFETVVYQRLVEEDTPLAKEISTVANDLDTSVGVISVKSEEDLVVGQDWSLLYGNALGGPRSLNCVVVLWPGKLEG